jgi:hypothetical protein
MALPETWLFGDIMDYFGVSADEVWRWRDRSWIRRDERGWRKNRRRGAPTYRPEQVVSDLSGSAKCFAHVPGFNQ